MSSRSIFFTSLLSLCLAGASIVGCAAPSADEADEDTVAESSDELSAAAQQLVGKYYSHSAGPRQYARLTLNANGTYTASVDISDVAMCFVAPCLGPEDGKWSASKSGGKLRLRLKASSEPTGRWYDAKKTNGELTITRVGKSQTLYTLGKNACLDSQDCSSSEDCAPRYCLMYCAANDPFCCGPSTCQPKPPPPLGVCCDPSTKPAGGIEGVWCCGDGSWQYDIGSGNQAVSCGSHQGAGNVCAAKPKQCGGFAGIPCGANEECIDDPTDSCDPKNGGADCGGICVAKTTTACGSSTCAAGEVCCNPLMGICTKPGDVCAM